jgi:hypothetical protein
VSTASTRSPFASMPDTCRGMRDGEEERGEGKGKGEERKGGKRGRGIGKVNRKEGKGEDKLPA